MDKYQLQLAGIQRKMQETLGEAKALTDAAASEGRGLNEAEDTQLKSLLSAVAVLKEQRSEVEAAIATRKSVLDIGAEIEVETVRTKSEAKPRALSVGEAFVKSEQYKSLLDRGFRGSWTTGAVETKTVLTITGAGGDTGAGLDQPDLQPGILPILVQQPTVAALAGKGVTGSNLIKYLVEETATNAAAVVVESGTKPESTFAFTDASAEVLTIATMLPVTEQLMQDVPALQSYLNQRLAAFIAQTEDDQLINGDGSGELTGYLYVVANSSPSENRDCVSDVVDAQAADHIYAAITAVRVQGFDEPDGIVMNPSDWADVALLKDSQGRYIGTNPFAGEAQNRLWGKPVVLTQNMSAGTALVGNFGTQSQVFRNGGLSLEASNSHSDFFARNKVALRAEERVTLVVYRPASFATADLSGS